jgi:hypothetical protein
MIHGLITGLEVSIHYVASLFMSLTLQPAVAVSCLPSAFGLVACCSAHGRPHSYFAFVVIYVACARYYLLFNNTVGSTDMPGRS